MAWTKPRRSLSPNIRMLIDRFNGLSASVTTAIVLQRDLKKRARLWEYFVALMQNLFSLQDISAVMAVV